MKITVAPDASQLQIASEVIASGLEQLLITHTTSLDLPLETIEEVLVVGPDDLGPAILRIQAEAGAYLGYTDLPHAKAGGKVVPRFWSDGKVTNSIVLNGLIVEVALLPWCFVEDALGKNLSLLELAERQQPSGEHRIHADKMLYTLYTKSGIVRTMSLGERLTLSPHVTKTAFRYNAGSGISPRSLRASLRLLRTPRMPLRPPSIVRRRGNMTTLSSQHRLKWLIPCPSTDDGARTDCMSLLSQQRRVFGPCLCSSASSLR